MSNGNVLPNAAPLPPHDQTAEEALLASVLIDPEALYDVADTVKPDDFFNIRYGWIYEAMIALSERNTPIDTYTVETELRQQQRLEEIGGSLVLQQLQERYLTATYAAAYAKIVHDYAIRRRLLKSASDQAQYAHDETMDVQQVVDRAEASVLAVSQETTANSTVPIKKAIKRHLDRTEKLMTGELKIQGIPTGFVDLDHIMRGWHGEEFTIVAGRPGMGKTSWLLSVLLNGIKHGARPALFSLEMSEDQLMDRLTSSLSCIPSQKIQNGELDEKEWGFYVDATAKLDKMPIFLHDVSGLTPLQLRSTVRRLVRTSGVNLVMVDYLQLMDAGFAKNSREAEVSFISRHMKLMAKELKIPVIAAAQLNRSLETRQDKRPQLSDLRESGSLEQDADNVLFIYRDEMYNEATERPNQADIIIAKHRNGPTGSVPLYFRKELTQFSNLRRTEVDLAGY